MLRRDDHIGRAEQGVRTGGEHGKWITSGGLEIDLRTGGASDPVTLGGADPVYIIYRIKIINQPLGILGDLEHPLAFHLMDDIAAAPLTDTVDNLFVRKYDFASGAPVDRHLLFVGQPLFKELQKNPLGPAVISGIGGIDLAVPVERKSQAFKLGFKPLHILPGDDLGMDVVFDRIVLGRQAKRIPSHRIEHVVALQPALAGNDVQRGIRARMPDMQPLPGRVWKLDQNIIFRFGVVIGSSEHFFFFPNPLPFLFNLGKIVLQNLYTPCYGAPTGAF